MQKIELTDADPQEIAEAALEVFRSGGTLTITYPEGNSFRSAHLSERKAPYEIRDADDGVTLVPDTGTRIPIREGSSIVGRMA